MRWVQCNCRLNLEPSDFGSDDIRRISDHGGFKKRQNLAREAWIELFNEVEIIFLNQARRRSAAI
jgi:hypothetical protein